MLLTVSESAAARCARINPSISLRSEEPLLCVASFASLVQCKVRLVRSNPSLRTNLPATGDPIVLWLWDASANVPTPVSKSVKDAEGLLGLRAANEALEIDPTDIQAKVIQISLGLDHDAASWKAQALAAGPEVMGRVVRQAITDGKPDLAATATSILGQISKREDLKADRTNPLTDALYAPDRRVQF